MRGEGPQHRNAARESGKRRRGSAEIETTLADFFFSKAGVRVKAWVCIPLARKTKHSTSAEEADGTRKSFTSLLTIAPEARCERGGTRKGGRMGGGGVDSVS